MVLLRKRPEFASHCMEQFVAELVRIAGILQLQNALSGAQLPPDRFQRRFAAQTAAGIARSSIRKAIESHAAVLCTEKRILIALMLISGAGDIGVFCRCKFSICHLSQPL